MVTELLGTASAAEVLSCLVQTFVVLPTRFNSSDFRDSGRRARGRSNIRATLLPTAKLQLRFRSTRISRSNGSIPEHQESLPRI